MTRTSPRRSIKDRIRCLRCSGELRVIDTEVKVSERQIRRRRICINCGHRETSYEILLNTPDIPEQVLEILDDESSNKKVPYSN